MCNLFIIFQLQKKINSDTFSIILDYIGRYRKYGTAYVLNKQVYRIADRYDYSKEEVEEIVKMRNETIKYNLHLQYCIFLLKNTI